MAPQVRYHTRRNGPVSSRRPLRGTPAWTGRHPIPSPGPMIPERAPSGGSGCGGKPVRAGSAESGVGRLRRGAGERRRSLLPAKDPSRAYPGFWQKTSAGLPPVVDRLGLRESTPRTRACRAPSTPERDPSPQRTSGEAYGLSGRARLTGSRGASHPGGGSLKSANSYGS